MFYVAAPNATCPRRIPVDKNGGGGYFNISTSHAVHPLFYPKVVLYYNNHSINTSVIGVEGKIIIYEIKKLLKVVFGPGPVLMDISYQHLSSVLPNCSAIAASNACHTSFLRVSKSQWSFHGLY